MPLRETCVIGWNMLNTIHYTKAFPSHILHACLCDPFRYFVCVCVSMHVRFNIPLLLTYICYFSPLSCTWMLDVLLCL